MDLGEVGALSGPAFECTPVFGGKENETLEASRRRNGTAGSPSTLRLAWPPWQSSRTFDQQKTSRSLGSDHRRSEDTSSPPRSFSFVGRNRGVRGRRPERPPVR